MSAETYEPAMPHVAAFYPLPAPPLNAVIPGLQVGRIVHFVLDRGPSAGEHRPAIIVKVWSEAGMVNLQVFPDSNGAFNDGLPCPYWVTSVPPDEATKKPRSWHWPEKV